MRLDNLLCTALSSVEKIYDGIQFKLKPLILFPRLNASSPVSAWSRVSAGSKEDIMITSTPKNESQGSAGFK